MSTSVLHVQKVSGISGSENHLLTLLPDLRRHGWGAAMIVLHEGEPGASAFIESLRARDVPTTAVRMHGDADPLAFGRLLSKIRKARPDILHTHLLHADLYGQLAGAAARVPLRVSTKHGFNEFRTRPAIRAGDRLVGALAHRQIAISRGLAEYLAAVEGFDPADFDIVHYGIAAGPTPAPYLESSPRLLAIGRHIPIKGFDLLLEALAVAQQSVPKLTLEIAGDGPERDRLCALAGPGVQFLGHVTPVQPLLERAAIVVVPSRGEGFGMVALEAMERGRAVIASDVGGLPEIVAHGETGLVVPSENVGALAAAIVELARNLPEARRMGEAGRRRALERFTLEECCARTVAVYAGADRRIMASRSIAAAASKASTKSQETR